jgi:hypothetical protein
MHLWCRSAARRKRADASGEKTRRRANFPVLVRAADTQREGRSGNRSRSDTGGTAERASPSWRQVVGDAQRYAREYAMDWDELSLERKKQMLHEASAAGRLGKTKEEAHAVWREQVVELGWTPTSVLGATPAVERTSDQRRQAAYGSASASLSAEFQLKAVLDAERLRVHAARGLIEAGAAGGRDDVDAVVSLIETRGFVHDGKAVTLIFGLHEGKERISHTEQLRIEQSVAEMSRAAARDRSLNLSDAAIRAAIGRVEATPASGSRKSSSPPSMRWAPAENCR